MISNCRIKRERARQRASLKRKRVCLQRVYLQRVYLPNALLSFYSNMSPILPSRNAILLCCTTIMLSSMLHR